MPTLRTSFVQRLIRWRFLIVVNVLVIVLLAMSLGREVVRSRSIGSEIAGLQGQAQELATRNIELGELKTAMQTESFIEREARLKLGMKKPGESVVVIQDETDGGDEGHTDDPSDPLGYVIGDKQESLAVANPTRWWYYFFDKDSFNTLSTYE
jgi:cell division protein FtsB